MTPKPLLWLSFACLFLGVLSNCASTPRHNPAPVSTQANQLWGQWYQHWRGTPYRYGLPRTTSEQKHIGYAVNANALAVGDLLFFKPDRNNNHVGVYLGDQRFVHASSSKGVTISALDNVYWLPRLILYFATRFGARH